jgi:hypothetical protein
MLDAGKSACRGFAFVIHQIDGRTWHYCRNGVLVHELRLSITTQQHAEIVEPSHDALQLNPVHKKYRQWYLVLADVVQKRILKVFRSFDRHVGFRFLLLIHLPSNRFTAASLG